jgi:uncharacterized damage-inducible protein DinB
MPASAKKSPLALGDALLSAWALHAGITLYLLEQLDESVWNAKPPGGEGRTIAAIVAHIHNVRRMLLVMARATGIPPKLDRHRVTPAQARTALARSAKGIAQVARAALESDGQVKNLRRDVADFIVDAVAHEAHHRGQIGMLARELGAPISPEAQLAMWDRSKRRRGILVSS